MPWFRRTLFAQLCHGVLTVSYCFHFLLDSSVQWVSAVLDCLGRTLQWWLKKSGRKLEVYRYTVIVRQLFLGYYTSCEVAKFGRFHNCSFYRWTLHFETLNLALLSTKSSQSCYKVVTTSCRRFVTGHCFMVSYGHNYGHNKTWLLQLAIGWYWLSAGFGCGRFGSQRHLQPLWKSPKFCVRRRTLQPRRHP